jgi:hypothetical protein
MDATAIQSYANDMPGRAVHGAPFRLETSLFIEEARELARMLLADPLPRRWSAELFLDTIAQESSISVQQRMFETLGDVSEWTDIAPAIPDGPPDLRGSTQHPTLDSTATKAPNLGGDHPS